MLNLADKDIKIVIITEFHSFKNLSRNMDNTKETWIKLWGWKPKNEKVHWIGLTADYTSHIRG